MMTPNIKDCLEAKRNYYNTHLFSLVMAVFNTNEFGFGISCITCGMVLNRDIHRFTVIYSLVVYVCMSVHAGVSSHVFGGQRKARQSMCPGHQTYVIRLGSSPLYSLSFPAIAALVLKSQIS